MGNNSKNCPRLRSMNVKKLILRHKENILNVLIFLLIAVCSCSLFFDHTLCRLQQILATAHPNKAGLKRLHIAFSTKSISR